MKTEKEKAEQLIEDVYEILQDTLEVGSAYPYCRWVAARICDELMNEHIKASRVGDLKFWANVKSEIYS